MIRIVIALAVLAIRVQFGLHPKQRNPRTYAGQHCAPGQLNAA